MTDSSPPQIRRGTPRSNPAPRRALPRVTPLGPAGEVPGEVEHHSDNAPQGPDAAATGRDLLIPNGPDQARRKSRSSAAVPTVAELMPSPQQPPAKSRPASGPAAPDLTRGPHHRGAERPGGGKGKHPKGKAGAHDSGPHGGKDTSKEVALQVTLPKALRKRLKAKAADLGLTPEVAVAQLVEVWVDG